MGELRGENGGKGQGKECGERQLELRIICEAAQKPNVEAS